MNLEERIREILVGYEVFLRGTHTSNFYRNADIKFRRFFYEFEQEYGLHPVDTLDWLREQ